MTPPRMVDNSGRTVAAWLPHMQSSEFLRDAIGRGDRTAECWTELTTRNRRVARANAIIRELSA